MEAAKDTTTATDQPLEPLTFPLHGSRLIEASAGTGKTFTLALLYIRLVLGHGDRGRPAETALMPPNILVVTFTDAATKELRERIRARLVEAAAVFDEPATAARSATEDLGPNSTVDDDPLRMLRADYPPEAWPGCARRLRQAADWMDEASIATIHGWCQRMLQEHAFATRGLFQRELVTDQTELILEILRDYWRTHFYPLSAEEARCIRAAFASPEALRDKLGEWLKRRDAALCYKGEVLHCDSLAESLAACLERERLQTQARALWHNHREELNEQLKALRPHLHGTYHDSATEAKFKALLAKIGDWADGAKAPDKLKNFAQDAFVFKKNAKVQQQPEHPAYAAIAAWLHRAETSADEEATEPPTLEACLLAHAKTWVARELPQRLNLRAEMGFDELLRELDAALTPSNPTPASQAQTEDLAATIREQFPVALIDEFQDTDPIQYRIFDAVYEVAKNDPETALVMIGDPKQAIYGFRGADIQTYLAARRATAGRHYTLKINFRSTGSLVEACNRFFGYAEEQPRKAFRFATDNAAENPIPYTKVDAKGRQEQLLIDGIPAKAMTFWQLGGAPDVVNPEGYRASMAAAAAAEVARWLEQAQAGHTGFRESGGSSIYQPLKPKDIAILVKDRKEATAMREALAALRINSVYLSDRDSVFETEEARDLLHWLRACASPTDEGLVRAALVTNTLALPLETLAHWQQDELEWEARVERFGEYRRLWQRQGVLAMLRRLMHDHELPARLLARPYGERFLTNLLHLAEWLQQSATALDGEQALIRHLSEHLDCRGEEFVVRLESDAELIQVVTIHKSKGLEYPLVLLPFICGWREIDGKTRQVPYQDQDATQGKAVQRWLEIAGKNVFGQAWKAADDERLSEDMRLLYVAVTRARHAVWLGIAPLRSGQGEGPQLEKSAIGHVLNGGTKLNSADEIWNALAGLKADSEAINLTAAPSARARGLAAASETTMEPARVPQHSQFQRWWIASYSALRLQGGGAWHEPSTVTNVATSSPSLSAETAAQETTLEEADLDPLSVPEPTAPFRIEAEAASPAAAVIDAADAADASRSVPEDPTPPHALHSLPRGSRYGTFLHGLLEWAATQQGLDAEGQRRRGYAAAADGAHMRRDMLARRCTLRGLDEWIESLDRWLAHLLTREWRLTGLEDASGQTPRLRLRALAPRQTQVEMEFWLESSQVDTGALDRLVQRHCLPGQARPALRADRLNGLLKGFIDLVFEHGGRYYVLDWKSNWLGPDDSAYSTQAMRTAMLAHRYDLQYSLYLLALHRQLRARLPDYDYARDIGGAVYVFLRGSGAASQGLFTDKPPRALIEGLDRLFAGVPLSAIPEDA
ncbi:exodeoxyribonuclease V subunit beta [Halochromatium salexigens]|uniref:RecBCD enzyme subunit RecB n=1 Tax=Halochromatium salexigens TaxID=49447 RepID=A0AAJ0UHG5_HALSE|nr:exodeoxyribonuclease V subunit beta [Halochromatium salexigens]MBK5931539.1 exodeoxyribonuclease V subunit beta [Halochromatium salexigens]